LIPQGIKPMIIQKESKNIEGFIEERKKLFTFIWKGNNINLQSKKLY